MNRLSPILGESVRVRRSSRPAKVIWRWALSRIGIVPVSQLSLVNSPRGSRSPFLRRILGSAHRRATWIALAVMGLMMAAQPGYGGPVFDRVINSGRLRLGVPYNLIPQGFLDGEGQWVGFEVDVAAELARHMNLKLQTVKVNDRTWRALLSSGRIDAALCRIKHKRSLETTFDFSVSYFFDSPHFLVMQGTVKSAAELKGRRVAAVQGSASEREVMRILRDLGDEDAEKNVVSYPDRPSCFLALGKEKVAAWIDSGIVLLEYASRKPGRFGLLRAGNTVEPLAMALPQDDSAWRDLVNFTIQDMAGDGSLDKIFQKWFGPSTPYPFSKVGSVEIWPE